jgi:uncharacterized protein YbjT (DUF2867 family)
MLTYIRHGTIFTALDLKSCMYIILGATGHVGSAVAESLLQEDKEIIVITRNADKASSWEKRGAKVELVDIHDSQKFRRVLQKGKRLFLLNPPAPPNTDTVQEELQTVSSILQALENSGIEKVVAESTYGAQPGRGIGDLGVLYDMEQGLKKMNIPATIIRAAYYMSNWDFSYDSAVKESKLYTFFPPDLSLPMVAPGDIGKIAARFLTEPITQTAIQYVEGPEIRSSADVANAFGNALGKTIEPIQIPPEQWVPAMKEMGFSQIAAESFAAMTKMVVDGPEIPDSPLRGATTIQQYISDLVKKNRTLAASIK